MPDAPERLDPMFPRLEDAQIAGLAPFGQQGDVNAGDVIVDQGDSQHGIFVRAQGLSRVVRRFAFRLQGAWQPTLVGFRAGQFIILELLTQCALVEFADAGLGNRFDEHHVIR